MVPAGWGGSLDMLWKWYQRCRQSRKGEASLTRSAFCQLPTANCSSLPIMPPLIRPIAAEAAFDPDPAGSVCVVGAIAIAAAAEAEEAGVVEHAVIDLAGSEYQAGHRAALILGLLLNQDR